jgi:hypothetical protein
MECKSKYKLYGKRNSNVEMAEKGLENTLKRCDNMGKHHRVREQEVTSSITHHYLFLRVFKIPKRDGYSHSLTHSHTHSLV